MSPLPSPWKLQSRATRYTAYWWGKEKDSIRPSEESMSMIIPGRKASFLVNCLTCAISLAAGVLSDSHPPFCSSPLILIFVCVVVALPSLPAQQSSPSPPPSHILLLCNHCSKTSLYLYCADIIYSPFPLLLARANWQLPLPITT
jgi:hypothetical protein